jgi:hypothetical protein
LDGGQTKYDLNGAIYSGCKSKYGKSLFIDVFDLKEALSEISDGSIFGTFIITDERI